MDNAQAAQVGSQDYEEDGVMDSQVQAICNFCGGTLEIIPATFNSDLSYRCLSCGRGPKPGKTVPKPLDIAKTYVPPVRVRR